MPNDFVPSLDSDGELAHTRPPSAEVESADDGYVSSHSEGRVNHGGHLLREQLAMGGNNCRRISSVSKVGFIKFYFFSAMIDARLRYT